MPPCGPARGRNVTRVAGLPPALAPKPPLQYVGTTRSDEGRPVTPADERIVELLAKWQKSLELHLQYAKLPDAQYRKAQDWPEHERPNRWILNLASQRLAEMQRIVRERMSAGDSSLSEALELMSFLSNLLGAEHLERRIPLAEEPAATEPRKPARAAASAPASTDTPTAAADAPRSETVVEDAVRLIGWGKAWHELPEAIARMAGRPGAAAVRKILKAERANIEQRAGLNPGKQ